MRLESSNSVLSRKLATLLEQRSELSRLDHSKVMGVSDGTLGRIKYGTGNPTLDVVDAIARYFRVPTWRLLQPEHPEADTSAAWTTTSPAHARLASTLMHSGPQLSPAAAEAIEALVRELTAHRPTDPLSPRERALRAVSAMFQRRGRAPHGELFERAVDTLDEAYRQNKAGADADALLEALMSNSQP